MVKPDKPKVQAHLAQIKRILKTHPQVSTQQIIRRLNPVLWGWANYYQHLVAKQTFSYIQFRLRQMIWRWAKRRHPDKTPRWIKQRYFTQIEPSRTVFGDHAIFLPHPASIPIIRYVKVIGRHSPFNPALRSYWRQRHQRQLAQRTNSRLKVAVLRQQDYLCGQCRIPFLPDDPIHFHHIVPRSNGGSEAPRNRLALHPYCHHQFHQRFGYLSSRLEPLAG